MKENVLRVLNVITTISTILLFGVYTITSAIYVIPFGSNWPRVIMILFYMLLSLVGFLGGFVQGIRTITNGRAGTIKWASIFQLVMFVPFMISACMIRVAIRNSSNVSEIKQYTAFIVIFLIINAILIVKLVMVKGCSRLMVVAETSKKTARWVIAIFIGMPVVIMLGHKLLEKYPIIERIFFMSVAIAFLIAIIVIAAKLIFLCADYLPFDGAQTSIGGRTSAPVSGGAGISIKGPSVKFDKNKSKTENDAWAIARKLDEQYKVEYKNITGSSPEICNFHSLKEGTKLETVKCLRKQMKNEAIRLGVEDKVKWF